MEKHQIDYLRLFVMTMKSLRNRKAEELEPDIFLLDNYAGDYIVSLYAGIWKKRLHGENTDKNAECLAV